MNRSITGCKCDLRRPVDVYSLSKENKRLPGVFAMKLAVKLSLVSLFVPMLFAPALYAQDNMPAPRPWQQVVVPSTREVAANFKAPPREYGAIQPFQSWNGANANQRLPGIPYDAAEVRARISRDLDRLAATGIFIINLSPGRRAPGEPAYLSPGHMDQVKYTVAELAKRNMRMWIQDESDYPSGFAGGYITERYPQLGMQDIVADITVHVAPGQTLQMTGALPIRSPSWADGDGRARARSKVIPIPVPADMQLKYLTPWPKAPRRTSRGYSWQVQFYAARVSQLADAQLQPRRRHAGEGRDLHHHRLPRPKATDAFLHTVHETYYNAVGDQFGKIVMGFFGDEPDYSSGIPWTPKLLQNLPGAEGLRPDIRTFRSRFHRKPIEEVRPGRGPTTTTCGAASSRNSFFGEQANWAQGAQRGVPGPSEPRGDYARAGTQRGRFLPRRALRRGPGHRQPEPV